MSEGSTETTSQNPVKKFSNLRHIHRRNREETQDNFLRRGKNFTSSENRGLVSDVSKQVTRKEMEGQIDSLTGLLNRNGFELSLAREVADAKRLNTSLTAIVLDANKLKTINDTLGHEAGDEYLKLIGEKLTETSRKGDILARTGGDEFIIIQKNTDETGVMTWWERTNQVFNENNISIAAGACQIDLSDYKASIKKADGAMYDAKDASRTEGNQIRFFRPSEIAA